MTSFHPPEKWESLNTWLDKVERVLGDWEATRKEAETCLPSS